MSVELPPISYFSVPEVQIPPFILNPDYFLNATALNLINDEIELNPINQTPFLSNVNNFNQNIGILQTAIKGLDEILQIGDILKTFTNPDKEILKEFENQINSIINNTTFLNTPVYKNTIEINGTKIDLTIPKFEPEKIDLKTYFEEIEKKETSLKNVLENLALNNNFENNFKPQEILKDILQENSPDIYNLELINPENIQFLFS